MWHLLLIISLWGNGETRTEKHVVNAYESFELCVEKSLELTNGLAKAFPDLNNYVVLCEHGK